MVKLNIKISGKADIQFETDDSLAAVLEQERPMIEKLLTLLAQAENNGVIKLCEDLKQIIAANSEMCNSTKEITYCLREMLQQQQLLKKNQDAHQQRQSHGKTKNSPQPMVRMPIKPENCE